MTMTSKQIAEAFSGHRFTETFAHFAEDIRWVSVGQSTVEGSDAVIKVCQDSLTELAQVTTEFTRFVSVAGTDAVAVDAIGRYVEPNGDTSVVSSCDIFEFDNGKLSMITSYAVELAPE